jgi:cytochrome c2
LVAPTATPLSPTLTPILATEPPTATAAPTEVTVVAGIDPNVIGDPEHGQALFNIFQPDAGYMCATCHWTDREDRLIGPGLLNIGARAASRVEGQNEVQYIYNSIVNPGAYLVEGFPDGLMPRNWAQIYTQEEINDIIAYLLTLR